MPPIVHEKEKKSLEMEVSASPKLPSQTIEYCDGQDWYKLATENFVLNHLTSILPVDFATTGNNLSATYVNGAGNDGVGATLTSTTNAVFIVDGQSPSQGKRILVKDQTIPFQNGIYTLTTVGSTLTKWVLTRAIDYDSISQISTGGVVYVIGGDTNAVTAWMQTSTLTGVGTSDIVYASVARKIIGEVDQISVNETSTSTLIGIANNPILPGNTIVDSTGFLKLTVGTVAQRPTNPEAGMIRFCADHTIYTTITSSPAFSVPLQPLGIGSTNSIIDYTKFDGTKGWALDIKSGSSSPVAILTPSSGALEIVNLSSLTVSEINFSGYGLLLRWTSPITFVLDNYFNLTFS